MVGDEEEEYPLSDGELSFSRWRSSSTAQPRVRPQVSTVDEPVLDFQKQFALRSESESDASLPGLGDRRGINITISTHPSWDPTPDSSVSSPADPHQGLVDRHHLSRTSSRSAYSRQENGYHGPADEEQGSQGSSELSLQELVERQEDDLISSRRSILVALFRTFIFILIWYFFSTGLTIYNKKLIGAKLWEFPAPLLMNTVHFTMQAVVSWIALRFFFPSMRPTYSISWRDYFVRVVPTAIATALDVDLTNASLVFISISFETMCKSAAPVFLLLFAFAFKLEVPSFKLFAIISIISSGVLLTGLGSLLGIKSEEQQFELLGFILVILAAVMSGFRWTVTQVLLQKKEFGLNNPLAVMAQLAPVMAILTGILSVATEPWHKLREHPFFDTYNNGVKSSLLLLLGGSLAFFMVLAEYLLISKTSAVTLTVAGVVKEVVTILVAVVFLGDDFTAIKGAGLAVILIGVSWFNWFKYKKFKEGTHGDDVEFQKLPVRYIPLTDKSKENEEMHAF
ncbi:hypothetical protein GOP47_0022797 [Adiantum capillus-veneris]|uniref:Sugar phosphate transporter domain-containing protein n=1 Tax=Adiantum capillus-veneris TaxID=13818 RepID=A0A9D4Z4M4_ADICA|nr:hypothetical protein GOP47_0022797 [Adiantum capillus-veneris]